MTVISCRKCGSGNIRKNGFTEAGAQKYHCRACKFYGTPVTHEEKQNKKEKLMKSCSANACHSAGSSGRSV